MLPITSCAVLVVTNPLGPVHIVFTVTETSTTKLNSTMQVRVMADPTGRIGVAGELLVTITEIGAGTKKQEERDLKVTCFNPVLGVLLIVLLYYTIFKVTTRAHQCIWSMSFNLTHNSNAFLTAVEHTTCGDHTSVPSTIRQSERREGKHIFCFTV